MALPSRSLTWVVLVLCVLVADSGFGAEPAVRILGPVRIRVPDPAKLPAFCHAAPNHRLFGCTVFTGQQLICNCRRAGDVWRMAITAQLVPVLYFTDSHTAEFHERMHVNDIAERLSTWIAALRAEQFDTESKCLERAAAVSSNDSVLHHLELFALQSNSWMQCSRTGERVPPAEAVRGEVPSSAEMARAGQK